jgi:GIY-YIG catalytic domain-containing protein
VEEVGRLSAADVRARRGTPPALPGVYAFRDGEGHLLYVGVSRDLGRRVSSYFAPGVPRAGKRGRIAHLAASVTWRTAPSLLEALVLEARTIAREKPWFNRRLKVTGRHVWVRVDLRDPFPRLEVTRRLEPGPWRYVGPLPAGRALRRSLDELADAFGLRTCPGTLLPDPAGRACMRLDLGQCGAPCIARTGRGTYGRALLRALAALGGVHVDVARASNARAGPAVAPLAPPVAGALAALRAARRAARIVVVVPAASGPGHRLIAVAGGRLRGAAAASHPAELRPAFARVLAALVEPVEAIVPREALDEIRVVTAWLASRAGRAVAVDVGRVGREAAWLRVHALAAPGPLFAAHYDLGGRPPSWISGGSTTRPRR